jgi:hypothetical protein
VVEVRKRLCRVCSEADGDAAVRHDASDARGVCRDVVRRAGAGVPFLLAELVKGLEERQPLFCPDGVLSESDELLCV